MPETYPGGVTKAQYIAVLREAAKLACTFCYSGETPVKGGQFVEFRHDLTGVPSCKAAGIHEEIAVIEGRPEAAGWAVVRHRLARPT